MEMQITLVWFQDLQLLKTKKKLNRQSEKHNLFPGNSNSFSKCKNPCSEVHLLKLSPRHEHTFIPVGDKMVQAAVTGVGSSKHCSFIPPVIQPPATSCSQY